VKNDFLDRFQNLHRSEERAQPAKREMPGGRTGKASLGRECLVSKKSLFEGKGKLKVQPRRTTKMQMMGDQAGQLVLARA
jgi:hypothetical protein